jgi:PAS domain S-box-containing protein
MVTLRNQALDQPERDAADHANLGSATDPVGARIWDETFASVAQNGYDYLRALGVAAYTTDAAGRITFYNDAAADLWGRRPALGEEWCGSWRLYRTDGRPMRHDECPMAVALRENRPVRGEEAIAERPDGTRVTFMAYPTPLCDASGRLVAALNVLVDVTERRRAEEEVRAGAEALAASNAVKDEFLGLVSHELRTPVTTIFGNAELLRSRDGHLAEPDRRSMLKDVAEDADRLLGIIENLFMLTRLDTGPKPELEPEVLTHIVRKSVESFCRRHPDRRVDLKLPDNAHVVVEADRTYLELLMANLLSNADKYGGANEPVEVVVGVQGGETTVRVLDHGIGITNAEASKLFAPFYRTEAAKKQAGGLGVGLAVCKRIVEALNGRIWARPRPGGGSELGFALPLPAGLEDVV